MKQNLNDSDTVRRISSANLNTCFGSFQIVGFENTANGNEAVALIKGKVEGHEPVLVRVHSQCITGDAFGSKRCDCGDQLHAAMRFIDKAGKGLILYMFQEGRGIGLLNKIKAYKLQDEGLDTVEANIHLGFDDDLRDYALAAQILKNLGVSRIRLLSNNPRKLEDLTKHGIEIAERVALECGINEDNKFYMETKKNKLGHKLQL